MEGSVWVAHGSWGDRYEQNATLLAGAGGFSLCGTGGGSRSVVRGRQRGYADTKVVLGRWVYAWLNESLGLFQQSPILAYHTMGEVVIGPVRSYPSRSSTTHLPGSIGMQQ